MKEKRNITIIDKKQIPSEEPARQYYFMEIAKKYVAELAEQKGAPLTFCVTTFGCQMNARDSEKLVGILEKIGYVEAPDEKADFVIYNTCTVFAVNTVFTVSAVFSCNFSKIGRLTVCICQYKFTV